MLSMMLVFFFPPRKTYLNCEQNYKKKKTGEKIWRVQLQVRLSLDIAMIVILRIITKLNIRESYSNGRLKTHLNGIAFLGNNPLDEHILVGVANSLKRRRTFEYHDIICTRLSKIIWHLFTSSTWTVLPTNNPLKHLKYFALEHHGTHNIPVLVDSS